MFVSFFLFYIYLVGWGLREKRDHLCSFPSFCPLSRNSGKVAQMSWTPSVPILSSQVYSFEVPVCETPGYSRGQGLEDAEKPSRLSCILQTLSSRTNCEAQDYWEWQLIANLCVFICCGAHTPQTILKLPLCTVVFGPLAELILMFWSISCRCGSLRKH